jgi:type I restriction enzyme S subunit
MRTGLGPHPSYKDSGTELLGEIPAHWDALQLGRFGRLFKGSGGTKEDETAVGVPCIRYGDIYTQHQFFVQASRSCVSEERAVDYTPIRYGDILFAGSGETLEEIGKSVASLIRSRACCGGDVIVFRPSIEVNARFLGYAADCRTSAFQKSRMGRGITVMHLYGDRLKYLWIALPPLAEQATIARYLDHETADIDALVAKKQRLIELLQEKRTALISHAVIKGLDPDVPMKDSGSVFLPEMPAHWQSLSLGRLCREVSDGPHYSPEYVQEGILFVSTRNIGVDGWHFADAERISVEDFELFSKKVVPQRGDVLYTKGGTTGIARAVDFDERFQVWVHVAVLKLRKELVDPFFLAYALNGAAAYSQSQLYTRGATNNDLGLTRMIRIRLGLPPIHEQAEMVRHLNEETTRIDSLIASARAAQERLDEYRSAFITAAVTGQIDVRTYRRDPEEALEAS